MTTRYLVKVRDMTPDLEECFKLLEAYGAVCYRFGRVVYDTPNTAAFEKQEAARREKEAKVIEGINNAAGPSHLRDARRWREEDEDRTLCRREIKGSKAHIIRKILLAQTRDFQSPDICRSHGYHSNAVSHQCILLVKEGKLTDLSPGKMKYKWFRVKREEHHP